MQSGVDPQVDYVFKRLFGNPEPAELRHALLNDTLAWPPTRAVRETTLLNPILAPELADEKVSVLDIHLSDQASRRFFLEMQRKVVPWVFAKRALYYWAHLHSRQLKQGDTHHTLVPTIGLCFLGESLVNDGRHHHVFRISDPAGVELFRDFEIHTVELNKFRLEADELQTGLDRWCYFLKHGATLDPDKLPRTLDVPVIRQALEVLMHVSQDEIEYFRYLSRLKAERDLADIQYALTHGEELARKLAEEMVEEASEKALKKGLADGLKQGLEKGLEQGLEKGELIGQVHFSQRLLKLPLSPKPELHALSLDALRQLADRLQAQLLPPTNGASS